MDDECIKIATQEGVPKSIIHVTGSPAIEELLRSLRTDIPVNSPWPGNGKGRRILFISESHSEDYGNSVEDPGEHGDFVGYTELTVREDLANILNSLGKEFDVVEKLHPDSLVVPNELNSPNVNWLVMKNDVLLHDLIRLSDLVVGMRSFALLESSLIGKPTISYQPNLIGKNNCAACNLGLAHGVTSYKQLKNLIENKLYKNNTINLDNLKSSSTGAIERIFRLTLNKN